MNFVQQVPGWVQPCPPTPPPPPPPPPPPITDLGGAGFVSGTGAFRPGKYFRAFQRFLGIARKKKRKHDQAELLELIRATRKLARQVKKEVYTRPAISGTEAARTLLALAAEEQKLADAVVKYQKIEEDDEEEAIILLLMH